MAKKECFGCLHPPIARAIPVMRDRRVYYDRCAGRTKTECNKEGTSCIWVDDPKGPQDSYCRGSNEVQRE